MMILRKSCHGKSIRCIVSVCGIAIRSRYFSEYFAWAYNSGVPDFEYDTGNRNSCSLVSPLISLTNVTYPELRYMDWIQTELRPSFDICRTEITTNNGQSWTVLLQTFDSTEQWLERGPDRFKTLYREYHPHSLPFRFSRCAIQ